MHLDRPPRLFMAPRVGGRRRAGGFTLIELMITVAIVGILAAVAYPSYKSSVLKGRRAEGRTALIDLAQQQERYMTQTGSYLDFGSGATGVPFKTFSGDNLSSAAYKIAAGTCSTTLSLRECVKLTATPTRAGSDPDFGDLTLTSTGVKSCSNAIRAGAGTCW